MTKIENNIAELRNQRYSCSQSTLIGIAREHAEIMPPEPTLKAAACGLRGGIGKTFDKGTCGALTGAVIALGLIYADDEAKAADKSKQLYQAFKQRFGTVCCGDITDENGKKLCNECCLEAGRIVDRLTQAEA